MVLQLLAAHRDGGRFESCGVRAHHAARQAKVQQESALAVRMLGLVLVPWDDWPHVRFRGGGGRLRFKSDGGGRFAMI